MNKPNIILINCDDLGYDDLGCYGSKVNNTPAIDRLAAEGIRFTDFYMASPVCSPSRGGMMTGCYPPRIGFGSFDGAWVLFPGQGIGLNPEEKTIAGILKDEGYATMLVGKWHCGDQKEFLPTRHGFDSYYGLPYSNDMGIQAGPDRGFPPLPLMLDENVLQQQPDQSSITERYVEQSVRFIRNNKKRPFFLYLAHMHVHLPHYPPERFLKQAKNGQYGAAVECVDWATDVIMGELADQGLLEDTLIIFTSDNGSNARLGGSNAPLRGTKGTTWEGGQRVPCIMYWKGKIEGGRVCSGIVSALDFLPTLAELAGGKTPADRIIDGVDISSLILGNTDKSPRDTFCYYLMNSAEALRHGKWKLHIKKGKQEICELYDLEEDIGEENNVFAMHPDIVKKLREMIKGFQNDLGDEHEKIVGSGVREAGKVENPVPLTTYDENHPYIIAMYDKEDFG